MLQWVALALHSLMVPGLILSSVWVSSMFSWFPPTSQKRAGRCITYANLPLGVNECVKVCAWCPMMDIHGVFPVFLG